MKMIVAVFKLIEKRKFFSDSKYFCKKSQPSYAPKMMPIIINQFNHLNHSIILSTKSMKVNIYDLSPFDTKHNTTKTEYSTFSNTNIIWYFLCETIFLTFLDVSNCLSLFYFYSRKYVFPEIFSSIGFMANITDKMYKNGRNTWCLQIE